MACLFIVSPITILQETRRRKLEDAIHHYIKNKMQEIVLAVDLVQSSLVAVDTSVAYKDKVQMLEDVRAICTDVSHNLTQKILDEAPTFNRHRASEPRARPKDVEESVVETVPVVVNIDDKKTTRQ